MALTKTGLFFAAMHWVFAHDHGLERHMICKSVEEVFSLQSSIRPSSSSLAQGPQGKRGATGVKGATGDKGEKGDRGPAAIVDYEHLEKFIERKVISKTEELTQRLERAQIELNHVKEVQSCEQNGGYASAEYCFVAIVARANYENALKLCLQVNGKPADIHNVAEQKAVEVIARRKISTTFVEFWLGLTYEPSTNILRFSNGTTVNKKLEWLSGYPVNQAFRTRMITQIPRDASASRQGIWNHGAYHTVGGVICMKSHLISRAQEE